MKICLFAAAAVKIFLIFWPFHTFCQKINPQMFEQILTATFSAKNFSMQSSMGAMKVDYPNTNFLNQIFIDRLVIHPKNCFCLRRIATRNVPRHCPFNNMDDYDDDDSDADHYNMDGRKSGYNESDALMYLND